MNNTVPNTTTITDEDKLPIKIILVERDDKAVVDFLKKFGQKIHVKVMNSPESCLEYLKNTYPPDAIVIGRSSGGLKLLETIRSQAWTRALPVIITSDHITSGLIKEIHEKGGD